MSQNVHQSIHIDAEPGVVFEALTTPDLVRRWLCHEADVDPRVGGKYEMRWSAVDDGAPIRYEGSAEIVDYSPSKHLSLRMMPADTPGSDSTVEFHIEPTNGASDLTLTQSGFSDDADGRKLRDAYTRGWLACLSALRSLLEDEPSARLTPAAMHRDLPLPGHDPCGIAWDRRHLWYSDSGRGRVYKLDPVSGRVIASFPFEGEPSGLAFDGECLWQADREERVVVKLSTDGKVMKRLPIEIAGELTGVAWDGQHLWIGDGGAGEDGASEGFVLKVQPRTGAVQGRHPVTPGVSGLAWDGSSLWVADFDQRMLVRVDPQSGATLGRVAVKGHPTGLTWDGERLWYADSEWKLASRILDKLA